MGKKLLLLPIWFFIFLPISIWGQECPTSVGITSNQGSNICQGTNVIFTANPTGGTSPVYEWTLNGTIVGSSSTYSSSSLNNQDKIRIKVSSSTADPACETLSDIFTITVNPNRTGTVQVQANNTSICPGENINFSIASVSNAGSGPVYTWKLNGNTVGTNSSSFSSSSLQNNDEIQLSIQSSIPCTPDFTSNVIVIQEKPGTPTQPGTITGNDTICPGTSQTYSITNVNDASEYIWTLPSGWSGNSTTNSITVTSGSGGGNISVQAKNSCGTSPARDLNITVMPNTPATPGTITGPTSVCPGISVDYSIAAVTNTTEYVWTLPNGTEQITNNPTISVTTNSSGNSNISVKARNSCGTSASKTLSVSVKAGKPATPGEIIGNTNICPGTTQTYTIPAVQGATSYNWTLPNGWTGSSSTRSITVTSNTTGGDIIVTAQNDCDTSDPRSLSISMKDATPATPGTISGVTTVCPTTSETYSVAAVAGATEYVWSIPGSFSTANTVTTNPSISITAGSSGSGNITVKARNDCGTSTAASLAISISPPAPVVPGNITGPLNVCSTATGISYSVAAVTNATSYIWSLPTGWNITSGINTRTITVSSSSTSGTISVIARNDCGDSPVKSITVNSTSGVPAQPGAITSSLGNNSNICPPESGITFSVNSVSGATGYNWILPTGWEITSGVNTNFITVKVNASETYQSPTSIQVEATNICGNSAARTLGGIGLDDYILTDAGDDVTICKNPNSPITLNGAVEFGNKKFTPTFKATNRANNIGFQNRPSNTSGAFTYQYTPVTADLDRGWVTIIMTVPRPNGSNSSCGTGIDEVTINFLNNPTANFSTTNTEICYNTNTSLNISGTPNTTVTYSNGSGNASVTLDASGNGTITTGNLTETTAYSLQSIAYTNGPGCSQNISSNTTITVNPIPSATLNYNDGPFCNSDSGSYTPSFTNTVGQFQGGTFSATGININVTDGSFSPNGVSPDTYTITYSFNDPQSCGYEDITTDIVVHDLITIPSQPSNVRVCEGDAIDLSIEATGDGLGYQWYKGSATGSPVSGATSSEFNINASTVSDSGIYYVMVTGISPCTELKSEEIEVIVDEQIQITDISTNAGNNEICENGSVTFSVSAIAGIETLQFQWYNSDGPISGATGNTYVLNNASLTNADDYYVEINGSTGYTCNSATSDTISLIVNEIPNTDINYSGPFCNSDAELKSVTFSNTAGDYTGGSFSYIVVSGGNNLNIDSESGEINPSASDPGEYEVSYTIAETGGCAEVIETTQVTITEAPTAIITFTDNQTEFCNDASQGIITPDLSGTGNYTGGTFGGISGINTSTGAIDLDGLTAGDYTITYSIPASDGCPSQSVELDILIHEKLTITSQPFNIGACSGEEIELEVAASGDDLNYQWYKGTYPGTSLNGATTANFGISPVSSADDGIYYVEVSAANSCSSVRSDEITLSVDENIIVSTQPQDQSACVGDDITFNISATANGGSVNYQWLFNGADLIGETGSSLNLTSVTTANAGEYSVFIEGPDGYTCSTITSGVAILTINEPPTVNAGDNFQVCTTSNSFNIGEDATASNYSSLKWNSSGSGTFGDDTALQTTYSPAAGETGSVTLILTANGNGVCPAVEDEVIVTIEALPVISVFEYAAEEFCISISDLQAPTITGENTYLNGTFDVEPTDAGDVLSIDGSGNINPSLSDPGEYLITYATPSGGICAVVEEEFTLIIGELPVGSFSYDATTYCRDTREDITTDPIITDAGGEDADSFSYTGTGTLALENTSGAIDILNSEAGEYTITRTVDYSGENEDGCEAVTATFDIVIFDKPIPDFTYSNTEYCQDDDNPTPILAEGAITGEFTWDSSDSGANLVINPTTGVIEPASSSSGTYTITNTVDLTNDVCEEVSFEFDIIIYEKKDPTFSYTETAYCISELQATVIPGFASGGTFSSTTLSSDYLNASTGQITWDTGSSIIGNHIINYTIPVNGPCEVVEHDFEISIDALPEGGVLSWSQEEYQRIFLTCEIQTNDLNEVLNLSGEIGEIIEWEYRTASNPSWTTLNNQNGSLNNSDFINILTGTVESTIFRVKIGNGACENGVYSQTAILSVIPSDIKPEPVQVTPEVLCYGSDISLSSEIKYVSEFGKFEGGDFTSAGIKNNGWNFTDPNGNEIPYDANANNGNPIHWHKTQPKWRFTTANINSPYNTNEQWWNPRNDGNQNEHFAIAQSTYSSNMDTPPFSLLATDEAVLTFDQAYNLTTNASIRVVLLKNGSEYKELYKVVGPAKSGAQDHFGYGTPNVNQMNIDLGSYIGESNLRVRFEYSGVRLGDIWAVDNIKIPEGPQDVLLQWFYDEDIENPDNTLEQIGVDNQSTVSFTPRKIGWNDFEVKTALLLDSNGDPCEDINNSETIRVFVFDQYTTNVTADIGECGNTRVSLSASTEAAFQGSISDFPTIDGYRGSWVITGPNESYTLSNSDPSSTLEPVNNPSVIFEAEDLGDYSFTWKLTPEAVYPEDYKDENLRGEIIENTGCPPILNPNEVSLPSCTTLDFDGINDFVSIDDVFAEARTIEMWIYPEESTGTIISGPGFEIKMSDLPGYITPNSRWYHIALLGNKLYIDGIDSGSTLNTTGTGNQTLIGAKWNDASKEAEKYFSGWIEEVRIWKSLVSEKEIRFMMNQRLDLNSKPSGDIEGEVVPNKIVAGSYYSSGGFNLDQDGDVFYNEKWTDLIAYYRLISAVPDPVLGIIPDTHKPVNGYSPDLALNSINARLHNMTTHQQNTSPTPYFSGNDGIWSTDGTWARPTVWDAPNSNGITGPIEWNIARINHNIQSSSKDIIMLGLLSETLNMELSINADQVIRITHYLFLDGNMDLEGESQLLQDHGSILANESQGWAEIDQRGRMSSYNYNYWTSPVSNQGSDNNSGYMLNQVLFDASNANNPQPVNFQNGYYVADKPKTSPITISNEWIWDFRGGTADIYGDWTHLGSDFTEIAGAGYSMKGTDGTVAPNSQTQNYAFRGKPNNGNIPTTELYLTNNKNYLVGNPYPSAIDAEKFLQDNNGVFNGAIYYWDHFSGSTHILEEYIGGYATYSLSGSAPAISNDWRINSEGGNGTKLPKRYIPVAQGFFLNSRSVSGQDFSGDIIFNNTQRVYKRTSTDPSIFLQHEEDLIKGKEQVKGSSSSNEDVRMKIRLKFESPKGYHRQILVTRDENTSNGFDIGYDAPLIENNLEDMYWWFDENAFVIQGVSNFEKGQILPLVIKTKDGGEFKIKIDETENWPTGKELYLNDKLNDSIHDILKEDYIAETEAGEIKDRFELVFFKEMTEDPDPVIPDPDDILDPDELPYINGLVGISYSTFSKQVKISNFDLLDVSKVMIFDMGGKLIQQYDEIPTEREILLGMRPVRSGVYIIKVFSENGISDKKVVIK